MTAGVGGPGAAGTGTGTPIAAETGTGTETATDEGDRGVPGGPTRLRVVAVGGGHGLAATIRSVRRYAGHTTAVVATADDGGSTGRLRSAIEMPAPGDLRRCVAAMAGDEHAPLVTALDHRFAGSDIEGHALGNLLLAGLHATTGDFAEAVAELSRLAGVDPACGQVLPASVGPVVLEARLDDGACVTGQVAISGSTGIDRVAVVPCDAVAPATAVAAVASADQLVLGPGSLFTSVLAAAVVGGLREAIAAAPGRCVYVCNVRAESGETRGYDVAAHVAALGRHGIVPDVVLAQRGALPAGPVAVDVVEADLVRPNGLAHDPVLLGAALARLVP